MQEIMYDNSRGESFEAETIEGLIPHIKKSLAKPGVKHIIIKMIPGKKQFGAAEEIETQVDALRKFFE